MVVEKLSENREEYLGLLETQFNSYLEFGSQEQNVNVNFTITEDDTMDEAYTDQTFQSRAYIMSAEALRSVDRIFSIVDDNVLLLEKFHIPMTSGKLKCLRTGKWLNDEVINMYCLLLKDWDDRRCNAQHGNRLKSWFFSSFFMEKLLNCSHKNTPWLYSYENVQRYKIILFRIFVFALVL